MVGNVVNGDEGVMNEARTPSPRPPQVSYGE